MAKPMLYPKTYVKLVEVIRPDDFDLPISGLNAHKWIWVLENERWERFHTMNVHKMGHTPRRLTSAFFEWARETKAHPLNPASFLRYYIENGVTFKFYQRPQDNGRWSYRHMGR